LMRFKAQEKNTQIVVKKDDNTPLSIQADATQLEQVFINIVKNALESVDNQGIIRFIIQPKNRQLVIENNGKPIPTEIMPLLFTPFFTNKNGGQGIGLTLIRDILTQHGFEFSLKTDADGWTRFLIKF
jgi:two-component system, NtrC family, nitrogen regulation sensor histidine kinase NtrY